MADWQKVTLAEDGVRAWRTELTPADPTSVLRGVAGDRCSVHVTGGPVDVYGTLGSEQPVAVLRDPTGSPLKTLENCLEAVGPRVDSIQVTGLGIVTLYARRI